LISDAGTPLISDPGYKLVVEARRQGSKVYPIPGASSVTAALSAGGVPSHQFLFAGFLPAKSGQRVKKLTEVASLMHTTLIFLEAPHRLQEFVHDAFAVLGDREVVIAREMTKRFEQFWQGTLGSLEAYLEREEAFRGEIVVLIAPMSDEMAKPKEETLRQLLEQHMEYLSLKEAVKVVQEATKANRSEIYDLALGIKKEKEEGEEE
jgi:16S rRNA (cytidine1402-2'-O)-methyltransferase